MCLSADALRQQHRDQTQDRHGRGHQHRPQPQQRAIALGFEINPTSAPARTLSDSTLFLERLSEGTRAALDAATSPQKWNVVFLSSPEFMFR